MSSTQRAKTVPDPAANGSARVEESVPVKRRILIADDSGEEKTAM